MHQHSKATDGSMLREAPGIKNARTSSTSELFAPNAIPADILTLPHMMLETPCSPSVLDRFCTEELVDKLRDEDLTVCNPILLQQDGSRARSRRSTPTSGHAARSILTVCVLRWTLFFASFSRLAMGIPSPTKGLTVKDYDGTPFTQSLFADLAILILVLLVLGTAQLLVAFNVYPLAVWATVMACSAFGWWCVRSDLTTSLGLSCALFCIWIISSYQYARSAFEKLRAPPYTPLAVIGMAIALDVLIVGYMTPDEAAISQIDLLNLSLPSASLVLAFAAVGLSIYQQHYTEPHRSENALELQQMP